MSKVLVINGPNLNFLGIREKKKYGVLSLLEINDIIERYANVKGISVDFFQSNLEGEIIDTMQENFDDYSLYILNAGALTHYSYSIRDAISSVNLPVIEVHMTNIYNREKFRHKSVIASVCKGSISGFGVDSYLLAVDAAEKILKDR